MGISRRTRQDDRGWEVSQVCPECHNTFVQPFKCITCGAQKLYDHTVWSLSEANEKLRARIAELEEQARLLRHASGNDHRLVHERNARIAELEAQVTELTALVSALQEVAALYKERIAELEKKNEKQV